MSKDKVYRKGFVTLYADATFRDSCRGLPLTEKQRRAAYAFWLRSDDGRLTEYKVCPAEVCDINQAEIYAICQGMFMAMKKWPDTKGFYITSDSRHALRRLEKAPATLTKKGKPVHDVEQRLKKKFDSMVAEYKVELIFRWVRGHGGGHSTPSWLNEWCDSAGRKAFREHDKKLVSS
jgi:ribonuclease HI